MSAGEPMRGGGAQEGQVAATADGVAVAAGAPGAAAAVDAAAAPPERPRRPPPEEDANFKFHNMPHPARPEHLVKEAEQLLFLAKIAEQSKRFTDMLKYTKRIVGLSQPLTAAERNMLATAYERQLAPLRAAHVFNREVAETAAKRAAEGPSYHKLENEERNIIVAHYNKYFVKQQLVAVCEDFMKVVRGVALPIEERSLLKTARAAGCGRTFRPKSEAMVFYKKHIADVCRYKAEVAETKEELEEAAEAAEAMYLQAKKNAEALFRPTHPLYLGLLLNMAVFYHDVMEKPDRGCSILNDVFHEAVAQLDEMTNEHLARETSMILTVMRDNLRVWATQQLAIAEHERLKREAWMDKAEETVTAQEEEERAQRIADKLDDARSHARSRRSTAATVAMSVSGRSRKSGPVR